MKPTAADFHFWEAWRARGVLAWAAEIDARRSWQARRYGATRVAAELHNAINYRAGLNPGHRLDTRNAISMLEMWRESMATRGYTLAGGTNDRPRTLADSMRASIENYGADRKRNPRGPTFKRILRRMAREA